MINRKPSDFLGCYCKFDRGVLSRFLVAGQPNRVVFVRRDWQWLVVGSTDTALILRNTTTDQGLTLPMRVIESCTGDPDAPRNYYQPLEFCLSWQVYWDAIQVWHTTIRPPIRRKRRSRATPLRRRRRTSPIMHQNKLLKIT
jgi:hypothetical protein